jgi:hypothetical protein
MFFLLAINEMGSFLDSRCHIGRGCCLAETDSSEQQHHKYSHLEFNEKSDNAGRLLYLVPTNCFVKQADLTRVLSQFWRILPTG